MELKAPICPICKKEMTNAIDSITKEISPYLWQCDCEEFNNLLLSRG